MPLLPPRIKILLHKVRLRLRLELSSLADRAGYLLSRWLPRPAALPGGKRRVLYLCELTPARAGRMARVLLDDPDVELTLLCHSDGYVPEFIEGNFRQVHRYRNAWHLRRLLDRLPRPDVIHAFAPKSYYPEIARRHLGVPFLLDMQDVLVTYHGLEPPYAWARQEIRHERSALAHADGVIGQSLEPRAGFRLYGIQPRPRTMYFPLYCDETVFRQPRVLGAGEEIHLVYAGGLAGSHRDRRQFGILQFHRLIELLAAQGIHFHLYPSPSALPPDYEEYFEIAEKNPYLHMHSPVPQQQLTAELAQYHFGLLPFFREDSELQVDKMRYSTSLKLFNFLEAGLPVIISRDIGYQSWMVSRRGCGLSIGKADVPGLAARIRALDYPALLARVDAYRRSLSLQAHAGRLKAWYLDPPRHPSHR